MNSPKSLSQGKIMKNSRRISRAFSLIELLVMVAVLADERQLVILDSPDLHLDGFVGPGHVSTIIGTESMSAVRSPVTVFVAPGPENHCSPGESRADSNSTRSNGSSTCASIRR
jgi:hypothetical protein